jgi:hypothetical protein
MKKIKTLSELALEDENYVAEQSAKEISRVNKLEKANQSNVELLYKLQENYQDRIKNLEWKEKELLLLKDSTKHLPKNIWLENIISDTKAQLVIAYEFLVVLQTSIIKNEKPC